MMKIQLNDMQDMKYLVNLDPYTSVFGLKRIVEMFNPLRYPMREVKLVYNNMILHDFQILNDINYVEHRFITIVTLPIQDIIQPETWIDRVLIERMRQIGISRPEFRMLKQHVMTTNNYFTFLYFNKLYLQLQLITDEMRQIISGDMNLLQAFINYVLSLPQFRQNIPTVTYNIFGNAPPAAAAPPTVYDVVPAAAPSLPPSNDSRFSALEMSHIKQIVEMLGYDEEKVKATYLSYYRNTQATIEHLILLSEQTNLFNDEDVENLVELSLLGYNYSEAEEAYALCHRNFQTTIEFLCDMR